MSMKPTEMKCITAAPSCMDVALISAHTHTPIRHTNNEQAKIFSRPAKGYEKDHQREPWNIGEQMSLTFHVLPSFGREHLDSVTKDLRLLVVCLSDQTHKQRQAKIFSRPAK